MGEKQQPKSCIYPKPEHYNDLADKPITKDGIRDNALEIIYICAYKAERFVNKQYVGVSVESREDIIQYVAGKIKVLIENYLKKDDKEVDFWAYMNKSIQHTASEAYQTEVKDGASEYIRHRYDMMSKYLDEGLTLAEIAEKCNCRVSTVRKTLRDGKVTHVSIDAEDDIGHAILDKVGKNDVYKIEEDEKVSIKDNILIRKVLKGMTREEKFIIETYLNIKKDCEKEWKDRTFAACKEYGITHKKVNDAIRNFKNEARKMRNESSEITGFTGKFSAKEHRIIVRREEDDCIYHELGHFVAWVAGDVDYKEEWKAIYDKEKSKVTYFNKGYATQNPKEYFADAYKDYILHRSSLSSTRPLTYKYVKAAVSKVNAMTSANFERMHKLYDSMWNKYGA